MNEQLEGMGLPGVNVANESCSPMSPSGSVGALRANLDGWRRGRGESVCLRCDRLHVLVQSCGQRVADRANHSRRWFWYDAPRSVFALSRGTFLIFNQPP